MNQVDVVVIGGGISGLAAAHALRTTGVSVLLLEGGARFGGVVRTEKADGFLLEGGPDAILAVKDEAIRLARELGIDSHIIPTNPEQRQVFVLHKGSLHPLPEGMFLGVPTRLAPFLMSRLFSWPGKLRMGFEVFTRRRSATENTDESIASFLRRRFGEEAVERLGEPLLAGIHAGDPESLSIASTFPRLVEMEQAGSLILGMRRAARRVPATPSAFVSFEEGLGELVAALVAALPEEHRRLGAAVTGVERGSDGYTLRVGGEGISARRVILALPLHRARTLLESASPTLSRLLSEVRFASTATVLLGYARTQVGHPLNGYGLLVPRSEGLRTTACTFMSTKFPRRAPEGHVLLRGFLGGARDPGVLAETDESLVAILRREMGPVLGLTGRPVLGRVFRWPQGTPQMEVGHRECVRGIEEELRKSPGLFLTGAGLRVTGIPDSIGDGRRVALEARSSL